MNDILSNIPEPVSVSQLSQKLKKTLETTYDFVRVRGELSKVKIHTSGHLYTDLKDENSVINAVCWRGVVNTLQIRPEEGLEVICTGKITTYPARSNYQLVIESMELAGQGALLKMLEERKKKLAAEGLFDPARKKQFPLIPERIGIITSPTGAVIRDILHRLSDRFPRHVLLWPATVQGANTVREVVAGIEAMNALPADLRPDVLIVARGGGSLEDLMPFNEEAIVRAVAASAIPVISAVGHETDTTLIDFAADRRAPTPTAAAEMAVPVREDLIYTVKQHQQRLDNTLRTRLKHDRSELRTLQAQMGDPQQIIHTQQQRVDYAFLQLEQNLRNVITKADARFGNARSSLRHPQVQIAHAKEKLETLTHRLTPSFERYLEKTQKHLFHAGSLLESFSFKKTLARGFALVKDDGNHVVTHAKQAKASKKLQIIFADDSITATPDAG